MRAGSRIIVKRSGALPGLFVLAMLPALVPHAAAFSGKGREKLRAATAVLKQEGGDLTGAQLEAAVADLVEAGKLTTSAQEVELVNSWLGSAYDRQAQAFHREGDHSSAVWRGKEAIKAAPDRASFHLRLGQYHQAAGDYFDASHSFLKAKGMVEGEQQLSYGKWLISNYMKMGHAGDGRGFEYAVQEIEDLLASFPQDGHLYTWKAQAQNELGDEAGAAATLTEAKERGILTEGSEKLLEQTAGAAALKKDEGFVQDAGLHFTLEFKEGGETEDWSRFIMDTLEAAYTELGYSFDLSPRHRMNVSVYFDDQFTSVFQVPWSGGNASGNRINLNLNPGGAHEEMYNTIYHEFAHHLVFLKANQMKVPAWLNEGLAMHQEPNLDPARFYEVLHAALKDPALGPMPFSELQVPFGRYDRNTALRAYAQSYDATHYLLERSQMPAVLAILSDIGASTPFDEAFRRATASTWSSFEQEWLAWRLERMVEAPHGEGPPPRPGTGSPDADDLVER